MSKVHFFSDRMLATDESLPKELLDVLRLQGLITPDTVKIHFCGVVSYPLGVAVFLPRNTVISDAKKNQQAAYYLLQAIQRYYKDRETGFYSQELGSHVMGGQSFSLVANLLDDYIANGLYVRRVKERTINSGKVNWARTISRSTPFPSKSAPIYLDLQTSRSRYIANCETAKIHAKVIRELHHVYGEIWLGISGLADETLLGLGEPQGDLEDQLYYLKQELQLSFYERDIFLLKSLIQYLESIRGKEQSNLIVGVHKFHAMWEVMLDVCLEYNYAVNDKLPVPIYRKSNGQFIPVPQKGQRTDTVLKHPDLPHFAVVDAKYYEATHPTNAPGWPDLVKQFYYANAVKAIGGKDAKVSNHFIFPGISTYLQSAHVADRKVTVESIDDCRDEYPAIYCHYQDPVDLLVKYVKGEKLIELSCNLLEYNNS